MTRQYWPKQVTKDKRSEAASTERQRVIKLTENETLIRTAGLNILMIMVIKYKLQQFLAKFHLCDVGVHSAIISWPMKPQQLGECNFWWVHQCCSKFLANNLNTNWITTIAVHLRVALMDLLKLTWSGQLWLHGSGFLYRTRHSVESSWNLNFFSGLFCTDT